MHCGPLKPPHAWAGAPLFIRNIRGITLSALAEELLPKFTLAFDQLGLATQALRNKAMPNRVRIAALPAIAQLWLTPRLAQLRQSHPEVSISVSAMETPPNLSREPYDITLFYSSEPLKPCDILIAEDRIFPVCAPSVASRLETVADLSGEVLLCDSVWHNDWDLWLSGQSINRQGFSSTSHSLFSIALDEARHGYGVLMAHEALVTRFLENGELVRPFPGHIDLQTKLVARFTASFAGSPLFADIKPVLFEDEKARNREEGH